MNIGQLCCKSAIWSYHNSDDFAGIGIAGKRAYIGSIIKALTGKDEGRVGMITYSKEGQVYLRDLERSVDVIDKGYSDWSTPKGITKVLSSSPWTQQQYKLLHGGEAISLNVGGSMGDLKLKRAEIFIAPEHTTGIHGNLNYSLDNKDYFISFFSEDPWSPKPSNNRRKSVYPMNPSTFRVFSQFSRSKYVNSLVTETLLDAIEEQEYCLPF